MVLVYFSLPGLVESGATSGNTFVSKKHIATIFLQSKMQCTVESVMVLDTARKRDSWIDLPYCSYKNREG